MKHKQLLLNSNLKGGSLLREWLKLRDEMEQARLDFIRTDLGLILTFATIVQTEYNMGNWEQAERTLAEAEKGYSDMLRFFSQAKG